MFVLKRGEMAFMYRMSHTLNPLVCGSLKREKGLDSGETKGTCDRCVWFLH